jgi:hypothetical protein
VLEPLNKWARRIASDKARSEDATALVVAASIIIALIVLGIIWIS